MDTSFEELKAITDQIYAGHTPPDSHDQIIALLDRHGIRTRQDDGVDPKVTISHPTSQPGSMVVGLRYTKNDGSKTEDLFLFQPDHAIQPHYRGILQHIFPEYANTHKLDR
jgi:hypothetical protein